MCDRGARRPKKGRGVPCQAVRVRCAFIERHEHQHRVRRMCKLMTVHPSSYYSWQCDPVSARGKDDQRLLGLLKHAWRESGCVYGYIASSRWTCAIWESAAASTAWPGGFSLKACVHRLAIDADLARVAASQRWWHQTTCSASSMSASPITHG